MHPRKLANTTTALGKSRIRRSSIHTSTSTVDSTSRSSVNTISLPSSTQQHEFTSTSAWHAGISAMILNPSSPIKSLIQVVDSNRPAGFSSSASSCPSTLTTITTTTTTTTIAAAEASANTNMTITSYSSSHHHPTLPDRQQRPRSIPISFLINPIHQSPRPFTFSSSASSTPSPPPTEASFSAEEPQKDSSPTEPQLCDSLYQPVSSTSSFAIILPHQQLSPSTSNSHSEHRSFAAHIQSPLNAQDVHIGSDSSSHKRITVPSSGDSNASVVFTINSSASSFKNPLSSSIRTIDKSNRLDIISSQTIVPLGLEGAKNNSKNGQNNQRNRSNGNGAIQDEPPPPPPQQYQYQQPIISIEETSSTSRKVSLRRTTNSDLKTTKTGKILRKPKKAGVNKKSTAYTRYLQQQSKYFAKHYSHLTPQQRMKIIAEEWAVSEKNTHTTRRRSRFSVEKNNQHEQHQSELPSDLSSLSLPLLESELYTSASPISHTAARLSDIIAINDVASSSSSTMIRNGDKNVMFTPHEQSLSSPSSTSNSS